MSTVSSDRHNQESLFEDSDTDYINLQDEEESVKKQIRRKVLVSPRVAKLVKKSVDDEDGYEYRQSPHKSPRNLKQQRAASLKSPRKSLNFHEERQNQKHQPLTSEKRKDPSHVPYYLLNFECIVRGVLEETDDHELFEESELTLVQNLMSSNLDSKKLFVRLFQRKHAWILRKAISYDEIANIDDQLQALATHGLVDTGSNLQDLESVLHILSAPSIKQLCKNMNIGCKGSTKKDFVSALLSHSKKKSFFTTSSKSSMSDLILKKARGFIEGDVFKVNEQARCIFMRILSLYSLSNWWDERESERGQQTSAPQLTTILLQNTGKITFPVYKINRQAKIFRSREDLLQFESVCALEAEFSELFHEKNWTEAIHRVMKAQVEFQAILSNDDVTGHVTNLPSFLRKFTAGSVLCYVLSKGVEVHEKMKDYVQATNLLQELLQQSLYLPDYHGHWYERLVLDLDQHLKKPRESLEAIRKALDDLHVQEARLLSLSQRVQKISNMKRNQIGAKEVSDFQDHPRWPMPQEPKVVTIQGKMMPKSNLPGEKTVFVVEGQTEGDNDLLCSVEEYVKEHYKNEHGYTNGIHAEGSVIHTIAAILLWDLIYDLDIPDVFRSPQQATPLDLNSPHFYSSRKEQVDQRLEQICKMSGADISQTVSDVWTSCCQISACPANWELFSSLNHFLGLIGCFSGVQLSGLCRRLMTNFRHTRSGFPDLTMWDVKEGRVAFIEVKGPNDRLSHKQILWLDYLSSLGLEAFVCHIEPLNAKRLKKSSSPKKKSPPKKAKICKISDSDDDFV